jgi:hypothetical protein
VFGEQEVDSTRKIDQLFKPGGKRFPILVLTAFLRGFAL